jgi:hypothetical protein
MFLFIAKCSYSKILIIPYDFAVLGFHIVTSCFQWRWMVMVWCGKLTDNSTRFRLLAAVKISKFRISTSICIAFSTVILYTVHKMGFKLRSIERMLKKQFSMARNFSLKPLHRSDVKPPEKTAKRNFTFDGRCLQKT